MKKSILFVMMIALVCFLLCGCTPKSADDGSSDVKLPTLNTEHGDLPDDTAAPEPVSQEPATGAQQAETEPAPDVESRAPVAEETDPVTVDDGPDGSTEAPVIASEEDPDEEVTSEYVVDGGDGFGFGGN